MVAETAAGAEAPNPYDAVLERVLAEDAYRRGMARALIRMEAREALRNVIGDARVRAGLPRTDEGAV